jgi:hypothetical protein
MFGIFPNIKGKGTAAKLVGDMLLRMRNETAAEETPIAPEFDTLILIDREVSVVCLYAVDRFVKNEKSNNKPTGRYGYAIVHAVDLWRTVGRTVWNQVNDDVLSKSEI